MPHKNPNQVGEFVCAILSKELILKEALPRKPLKKKHNNTWSYM